MKSITLIRHGKAGFELGLSDFKRPLTQKGIENSNLVGQKFKDFFNPNSKIFSSIATRAASTAQIMGNNEAFEPFKF